MKEVFNLIRSLKKPKGTIHEKKGFRINYIGLTETGMEVYILLFDTLQHALRYDRENDAFYQEEWVKIKE